MPRTTFPSSPLSLSTSPRLGPRTTLTSSCWSSCSQASVPSTVTQSNRFRLHGHSMFNVNQTQLLSFWLTVAFSFLTVGLYYCFNNLSDARIFIIMYGVTSMYFSAVMVRPVKSCLYVSKDSPEASSLVCFLSLVTFRQCDQKNPRTQHLTELK